LPCGSWPTTTRLIGLDSTLIPPVIVSEQDPEKWKPVFRKDHAPPKRVKSPNRFNLKRLEF
jgi:hypothetical protein